MKDPAESDWIGMFDVWIATGPQGHRARAYKQASEHVYREMWRAFSQYCIRSRLTPDAISNADLELYLRTGKSAETGSTSTVLSPRYAWRVLHLIDRVLRHDAERLGKPVNIVASQLMQAPSFRHANCVENDKLPVCLSDIEYGRLVAHLTASPGASGTSRSAWRRIRDHAAIGVMLGAGLTPGEMRRLALADVRPDPALPQRLHLRDETAQERCAPIAAWAADVLRQWLHIRVSLAMEGPLVFPSTLSGKSWSHTGSQQAGGAVLALAGVPMSPGGLFRLRHTFALRHLQAGTDEKSVANWLGYRDRESIAQYRSLYCGKGHTLSDEQL